MVVDAKATLTRLGQLPAVAFGDAVFAGSTGAVKLAKPMVAMATTADTPRGRVVRLLTDRPIEFAEAYYGARSLDYEFAAFEFTLDAKGFVETVQPLEVIFNPYAWHTFLHMYLAAFMVTGFLVASIYAVGMLKGRRDRYHRLGLLIPLTVAAIAATVSVALSSVGSK